MRTRFLRLVEALQDLRYECTFALARDRFGEKSARAMKPTLSDQGAPNRKPYGDSRGEDPGKAQPRALRPGTETFAIRQRIRFAKKTNFRNFYDFFPKRISAINPSGIRDMDTGTAPSDAPRKTAQSCIFNIDFEYM